jgi:hypothetical protein
MSKGAGRVQQAIIAAFKAHPDRFFTVEELAEFAYPGIALEAKHKDRTSRAVNSLMVPLGLMKRRVSLPDGFGWRNEFIQADVFEQMVAEARKKRAFAAV